MPVLTITARFPLGVFLGHGADGVSRDHYPSTRRLHGALVQSAGKGGRAVVKEGDLRPSIDSLAALEWLENHPPDAIQHPEHCAVHRGGEVVAFRAEGTFDGSGGRGALREKKARKGITGGEAVAGVFGWQWDDVPAAVHDALTALCEDVACLGEGDSPVVLSAGIPLSSPLRQVTGGGQFTQRGIPVPSPAPGFIQGLEDAYDTANPRKRPSPAADGFSGSQRPSPSPAPDVPIRNVYYATPTPVATVAPWTRAIVLPVRQRVDQGTRVPWCVAFHRMLAQRLGDDAPPVITGDYAPGVTSPANRVAIHLLDQSVLRLTADAHRYVSTPSAFVVLLPNGMAAADSAALWGALGDHLRIYRREGVLETEGRALVSGEAFWAAPGPDKVRSWVAVPALVAETRRQPADERGSWTLSDAALLSLGFVFRDHAGVRHRGTRGYRELTDWVRRQGAQVLETHLVPDSVVSAYAHKLPKGLVTQAYRARLDLGTLASDTAVLVAGQSRHVGGGLLVPVDLPTAIEGAWPR